MRLCDEQPPFAIPSTALYHPEDPPDECGALGVGIIFVSWNDFSWFNCASALNAKNWADIKIFLIGRELISDSLQECPHPSRFRCWHLTTLCWDYVSGINSWNWDLCSFLHATKRILWLVMVPSAKTTDNLSRFSRPLTLSFSIMACLTSVNHDLCLRVVFMMQPFWYTCTITRVWCGCCYPIIECKE